MTLPKISFRHQNISELNEDYILGNISTIKLEDIIFYNLTKKQSDTIDSSNDLGRRGFSFLTEILDGNYYLNFNRNYKNNTILCSILYTICQEFSFLKCEKSLEDFIYNFRVQMGIDLMEKSYHKKLNILKHGIKRKQLEEILLRNPTHPKIEYDLDKIPELDMVLKYFCLRFNIGITIINHDKTFKTIMTIPDRLNIILVQKDNQYMTIINKYSDHYLHNNSTLELVINVLKKNNIQLRDIKQYKVAELKEIAEKYGINVRGKKKEEMYLEIKKNLGI